MKKSAIILFIIGFTFSCAKEDNKGIDYRTKYSGDFTFTAYSKIQTNNPNIYDTIIFEGNIHEYLKGDASISWCKDNKTLDSLSNRITIIYQNSIAIIPKINEKGKFMDELAVCNSSGHYISGGFINENEVEFEIKWVFGALGYVDNHHIHGIRK